MVEEEVDSDDEQEEFDVRRVNGLAVVADDPMPTNLSRPGRFIPSQSIRILTLEDGSQVHACAESECVVFGTRGDVQAHRWRIHGVRNGKKVIAVDDQFALAMTLPLGELMEMAQEIQEWQKVFDLQQNQIDGLKDKLLAQAREHREQLAEAHRAGREAHQQQTADMRAELLDAKRTVRQYEQTFAKLGFVPKKDEQ